MGDFNCLPGSPPYLALVEDGALTDARLASKDEFVGPKSTWNGFRGLAAGRIIDHIFVRGPIMIEQFSILDPKTSQGRYASDHLPIRIVARKPSDVNKLMSGLSRRDRSRLLVVLAALLWSTSGFYAKAPWFDDWPMETRGVALTFWRAVFAALTVLPFVRRPEFRVAMAPMSLAFVAMTYSFLVAMVNGSETTTIWLQYVGPAWVAVAGVLGIGDRPRRSDWVMVGLSLLGIGFIIGMESRVAHESLVTGPVGLALFSGLMYAVVMVSLRRLRGVDVAWLGLLNHLVSVVCLAPLVLGKAPLPHGGQWIALFCLGAVQLAILT